MMMMLLPVDLEAWKEGLWGRASRLCGRQGKVVVLLVPVVCVCLGCGLVGKDMEVWKLSLHFEAS